MHTLLSRKDVCSLRGIHPTTLFRWERQGLIFEMGRITESRLAWWLEQAEAARRLGIKVRDFLLRPREDREKLLEQAHVIRCRESDIEGSGPGRPGNGVV